LSAPQIFQISLNRQPTNLAIVLLQGIPLEVSSTHELTQITLDYKRECQADDVVESLVSPENSETADVVRSLLNLKNKDANTNGKVNGAPGPCLNSSNCGHPPLLFLHVLRLAESGKDINLGRTEWRRKPTLQTYF
jgi:fatty acyl-ACP thioesterase A